MQRKNLQENPKLLAFEDYLKLVLMVFVIDIIVCSEEY